jgi:non-ribosomal peptide synthetase component F
MHKHRGVRHFFDISPALCAKVMAACGTLGTTPYRCLLAAFYVFLWCYSGLTDLCVGSPFASRCPGIANTIGFFANTIVLRTDLSGNLTFREFVKKVDWVVLRGLMSSELSFEKIVEAVQPARDPSRTPLFQISFRGRTEPYARLQLDNVAAEQPEFVDNGTAKFDLAMEVEITTGKACFVEYCSDLFREQTVLQMVEDYLHLIDDLVVHCDKPLSEIPSATRIRDRVRPDAPQSLCS